MPRIADNEIGKDGRLRLRLSIPAADQDVMSWIEEQEDPSASFRAIVRAALMDHGLRDEMCYPITQAANPAPVVAPRPAQPVVTPVAPVVATEKVEQPKPAPAAEPAAPQAAKPAPAPTVDSEDPGDVMGSLFAH